MQINSVYPSSGATNISRMVTIEVEFDMAVDTTTVSDANVLLQESGTGSAIASTISFSNDETIMYVKPDLALDPETTYTFKVVATDYMTGQTITSQTSSALTSDWISRFTTTSTSSADESGPLSDEDPMYSDIVAPEGYIGKLRFMSAFPRHAVVFGTEIKLEFSKKLDPTQAFSSLIDIQHASLIDGEMFDFTPSYSVNENVLTINFDSLRGNCYVSIYVSQGLEADDGNTLSEPVEVDYFTRIYPTFFQTRAIYLRLGNLRSLIMEKDVYMALFDAIIRLENLAGKQILDNTSANITQTDRSYVVDRAMLTLYENVIAAKEAQSGDSMSVGSFRVDIGPSKTSMVEYLNKKVKSEERSIEADSTLDYARRSANRTILFSRDWRTVQ